LPGKNVAHGKFQDVPTEIGKTYHLSFWLAGNPEFAGAGGGPFIKVMKLGWGSGTVATLSFDVTGQTDLGLNWTNYSFDLTATAATTRLEFDSLTGGFAGPMIDDLSLTALAPPPPAPLPSAFFLGLFGGAGALITRRRFMAR
jgi:hypothetical protein